MYGFCAAAPPHTRRASARSLSFMGSNFLIANANVTYFAVLSKFQVKIARQGAVFGGVYCSCTPVPITSSVRSGAGAEGTEKRGTASDRAAGSSERRPEPAAEKPEGGEAAAGGKTSPEGVRTNSEQHLFGRVAGRRAHVGTAHRKQHVPADADETGGLVRRQDHGEVPLVGEQTHDGVAQIAERQPYGMAGRSTPPRRGR